MVEVGRAAIKGSVGDGKGKCGLVLFGCRDDG